MYLLQDKINEYATMSYLYSIIIDDRYQNIKPMLTQISLM